MIDRERKVDVSKMSAEEVDVLGIQIGNRIKTICDEAVAKANLLLNIYGASAKMMIEISELPQELAENMTAKLNVKKKRGRPSKKTNLKQEQLP